KRDRRSAGLGNIRGQHELRRRTRRDPRARAIWNSGACVRPRGTRTRLRVCDGATAAEAGHATARRGVLDRGGVDKVPARAGLRSSAYNGGNLTGSGCELASVSVVVLSHNRREELVRNVETLCAVKAQEGFELIVVDNASNDGTRSELLRLKEEHPGLLLILSDVNAGVAGGRNLGWRAASREFILNLDDDTRVDLAAIRALYAAATASQDIGIVTPRVVHAV